MVQSQSNEFPYTEANRISIVFYELEATWHKLVFSLVKIGLVNSNIIFTL